MYPSVVSPPSGSIVPRSTAQVTAVYVAPETGDASAGKKPEGLGNIVIIAFSQN